MNDHIEVSIGDKGLLQVKKESLRRPLADSEIDTILNSAGAMEDFKKITDKDKRERVVSGIGKVNSIIGLTDLVVEEDKNKLGNIEEYKKVVADDESMIKRASGPKTRDIMVQYLLKTAVLPGHQDKFDNAQGVEVLCDSLDRVLETTELEYRDYLGRVFDENTKNRAAGYVNRDRVDSRQEVIIEHEVLSGILKDLISFENGSLEGLTSVGSMR